MTITKERFDKGLTWEDYLARFKLPTAPWKANYQDIEFDAETLAFFKNLPHKLSILTTTEDWCGDARTYVPVVARLADECPNIENRIFLRDENPDITDNYLLDGSHRAIPVFILFDQDFRELGHFIERPPEATVIMQSRRKAYVAEHPEHEEILSKTPDQWSDDSRKAYIQMSRASAKEHGAKWANLTLGSLRDIAAQAV